MFAKGGAALLEATCHRNIEKTAYPAGATLITPNISRSGICIRPIHPHH